MSWHEAAEGGEGTGDAVAERQADDAPSNIGATGEQLLPGQRVQAQMHGVVHWMGTVETVAIPLGMVWIREDGLGERKLLDLREYQVHPQDSADG
ncbi:hypothetical protein AS188_10475 [Kocuria flava]|uniref:Uncharacterized protein n=1 Tax=Kocuria flava TaxID=446860 RepID=A0A0U3HXK1_9MICC|nr:hypothetical protein [Kocuria flava]ALU40096.1 hypothetical protein AS188_10475 [Kocuria flava]GEO93709.1 hypothetical protein KFL01_30150 [Kocuria flava]